MPRLVLSPERYQLFVEASLEKYEYRNGEAYKRASSNFTHNQITSDFLATAMSAIEAENRDCLVLSSDMKIYVAPRTVFFADVVIVCGQTQIDENDCLRNPAVIVEVLSPSTERYDRTTKFRDYQQIPLFSHYILIAPDEPAVRHYAKNTQGQWVIAGDHVDLTDSLRLPIGGSDGSDVSIPLSRIYGRVSFDTSETTQI